MGTSSNSDAGDRIAGETIDRATLHQRTVENLLSVWRAYADRVPHERDGWRIGAAYVRESTATSMTREAPITQLRWVLDMFSRRKIWAPWDAVYFDAVSATSVEGRPGFQRLIERALRGDVQVVGAKASDRLFRSMEDAKEVGDALFHAGVEIVCEDQVENDPRNPHAWQNEMNQRQANEFWSRRTSEKVGKELERLSADGRPLGNLPEGYRVARREESFQGVPGKILAYEPNEPFASIIVEGKERYLAGASFSALAAWSATTECNGLTPKGRVMNWYWWNTTLRNPKYAGHHMPSTYQGFKPGKDRTPKRPRRKNGVTPLVPCMLPPLWPLSDFDRIVEASKARAFNAKDRPTYRSSLLSTIAVDEHCGHRMEIHSRQGDIVRMVCGKIGPSGRHSSPVRVERAEAELDALIGGLSLTDASLLSMVEQELAALVDNAPAVRPLQPNPEIGRLQAALAALGDLAPDEVRGPIIGRLAQIREQDQTHRLGALEQVRRYRVSVDDLRQWAAVWGTADVKAKNGLLKAAGLKIVLGRDEGARGHAEIRAITVEDPVFALALAAVLGVVGNHGSRGLEPHNPKPLVHLPEEFQGILEGLARLEEAA